ncbi:hypothetical protein RRG08_029042 [Elysia crispata]|uniref:NADP-dependent oxidoreductase domain-containing protein n=1 Tax=Elysia crispata TaxID=231223 RepID=A0AAE1AJE8_9GAST|nr:hypothetical protein RRG08_029042 [Elysia crispata]
MAAIPEDSKVKYNFLGKSGLKVSNICLGTMTFGENMWGNPGQSDEAMAHQILDRFAAYGGNFLDTADIYGPENSESIIGTWLERQTRENFVVATKCRVNMNQNVNSVGLSRRHITNSIDGSLGRLRTDYVDVYQQQYSLASRDSELEAFQVCKNEGIGVLPWSPLKGGLLTGKVKRGQKPSEGRLEWAAADERRTNQASPFWKSVPDKVFDTIDVAETIANKHGRTIAQVALRWVMQKDVTSSVIIGARTMEQLDQNMGVNGWSLSAEEMKQLDDVSAPEIPYPYVMINRANEDRVNRYTSDYYVK